MDEAMKSQLQTINQVSNDVAEIKGTLKAWAPLMTPQVFKKNISLPAKEFARALPELKAVAQIGAESKTPISTGDLAVAGRRAIELVKADPGGNNIAWETLISLVKYRSALDALAPPPINFADAKPLSAGSFTTRYFELSPPGQAPTLINGLESRRETKRPS